MNSKKHDISHFRKLEDVRSLDYEDFTLIKTTCILNKISVGDREHSRGCFVDLHSDDTADGNVEEDETTNSKWATLTNIPD